MYYYIYSLQLLITEISLNDTVPSAWTMIAIRFQGNNSLCGALIAASMQSMLYMRADQLLFDISASLTGPAVICTICSVSDTLLLCIPCIYCAVTLTMTSVMPQLKQVPTTSPDLPYISIIVQP